MIRAGAIRCSTDPDDFVREEATRALSKFVRDDVLRYVVATYGSEDERVRRSVVTYLTEGPFESGQIVFARALGDTPEIFGLANNVIMELPREEALHFLRKAVDHREPGVRRGAVQVLQSMGDKEATEMILSVYERDIEVDQVRSATRTALRELRQHLPIEGIVDSALTNPDKFARARSIKLLGVVGGTRAKEVLLKTLGDSEPYLRGTAVSALRVLGDPEAIEPLEKLLLEQSNQRMALQIKNAVKELRKLSGTAN